MNNRTPPPSAARAVTGNPHRISPVTVALIIVATAALASATRQALRLLSETHSPTT